MRHCAQLVEHGRRLIEHGSELVSGRLEHGSGSGQDRGANVRTLRPEASYVRNIRTLQEPPDVQAFRVMAELADRTVRARHVGARIRARRRAIGLSQEEAARRLGMRRHHYSDWERGIHEPEHASLLRLALAFRCNWTDFFNDTLDDNGELVA